MVRFDDFVRVSLVRWLCPPTETNYISDIQGRLMASKCIVSYLYHYVKIVYFLSVNGGYIQAI
jgi:hypothetical protein